MIIMNSFEPLVSVITPAYNHEKFISDTIESVINQTYQNWEMLVVDDCSTDGSWEIIQEWTKKDSRIKAFRNNENKGLIPNWEFLTDNSKGNYIAFLEGDDYFCKDNLKKKIEIFEKYPDLGMVYCNFSIVNESGVDIMKNYYSKQEIKTFRNEKIKPEEYLLSSLAPFSTYSQIMITREVIKNTGLPRSLDQEAKIFLPSDWDFNFRTSINNKIYFVDEDLLKYRKHSSNNSSNTLRAAEHYELLFRDYEKEFSKNKAVLGAIEYQRGKIQYLVAMYYLENQKKYEAWRTFINYVMKYPGNIFHDFKHNVKLFIRLLLPRIVNESIIKKYYGN